MIQTSDEVDNEEEMRQAFQGPKSLFILTNSRRTLSVNRNLGRQPARFLWFAVFDRDHSGFIDACELRHVMSELGEALTDRQLRDMMETADLNGDGKIDFKGKT